MMIKEIVKSLSKKNKPPPLTKRVQTQNNGNRVKEFKNTELIQRLCTRS